MTETRIQLNNKYTSNITIHKHALWQYFDTIYQKYELDYK